MKRALCFLFSLVSTLPLFGEGESDLVLCGMNRVFILDGASGKQTWEWTAESSPVVPIENRKDFATTDECKVYQDLILITSSSGGVALVERKTKKSRFFTTVRNAHSACLLPGQLIAVAASFGGDEVRIFNQTKSGAKVIPKMIVPLYGAHGVEWDGKRKCLWALGTKELLKISIARDKATVQNRFELPASGGHDLSWWDQDQFVLSVDEHCFLFAIEKQTFAPFAPLKDEMKVKSIDRNRKTGQVVWHKGTKTTWWSDTVRFLSPYKTLTLREEKIYKVRWDESRAIPKALQ